MSPFVIKSVGFSFTCFVFRRNSNLSNAISVDHDQNPHSAASDLGLHCLLVFLLSDTGHKSDNVYG